MKSFGLMFFSNKEVLKSTKFNIFIILLLFFINVSLISTPNFLGKMESVGSISELSNIEEVFIELYKDELNCYVENYEMTCDLPTPINYVGYEIKYEEIIDLSSIESSTVFFSKEHMAVVFVDENELTYPLVGNYKLLEGLDFSTVSTEDTEGLTREEHYQKTTDNILSAVYYSTLDQQLLTIYMMQFIQTLIYVMVVTGLFMLMNFKAKVKKVTYKNALKIIITAMVGPALLVAIIALYSPGIASLFFFIIIAIRAMLIYYKMNFSDQNYID